MSIKIKTGSGQQFTKVEGNFKKYLNSIEDSIDDKGALTVGLQKDAQDYNDSGASIPSGFTTNVVFVGFINEVGGSDGSPPARYWLRRSIEADTEFYKRKIVAIHKELPENTKMYPVAMAELGRQAVDRVQRHVETNDIGMQSNAESTQLAKGGDTPMVDTGHLLRQIEWKFNQK